MSEGPRECSGSDHDRSLTLPVLLGALSLGKRESDGTRTTLATAGSALSLTSGTWYEARVMVNDDPGDSSLQQLVFTVDTLDTTAPRQGQADGDSDYSDETAQVSGNRHANGVLPRFW